MSWDGICVAAARTRQQGRVNKYEVVRSSRDSRHRFDSEDLGPMRSIEFAGSSVRSIEQGTRERHERRVTSVTL